MGGGTVLVIGGSGFLSGTVARAAVASGDTVAVVTRGRRPAPSGAHPFVADRHDRESFAAAVDSALALAGGRFDLVVDAIAFTPEDARQDVELFSDTTNRLVLVSTDFVYDPGKRRFPQREDDADYLADGYGGRKRAAEEVLVAAGTDALPWVVVRPGHIYGPGSELGCLPPVGRDPELLGRLRRHEQIELLGGGHFLQQPVFVGDLVRVVLELGRVDPSRCVGGVLNVAGPRIVESVEYYRLVARELGVDLAVTELPVDSYARAHPEKASFICHRFYDLARLAATGVRLPDTPLATGLREHVRSLIEA